MSRATTTCCYCLICWWSFRCCRTRCAARWCSTVTRRCSTRWCSIVTSSRRCRIETRTTVIVTSRRCSIVSRWCCIVIVTRRCRILTRPGTTVILRWCSWCIPMSRRVVIWIYWFTRYQWWTPMIKWYISFSWCTRQCWRWWKVRTIDWGSRRIRWWTSVGPPVLRISVTKSQRWWLNITHPLLPLPLKVPKESNLAGVGWWSLSALWLLESRGRMSVTKSKMIIEQSLTHCHRCYLRCQIWQPEVLDDDHCLFYDY